MTTPTDTAAAPAAPVAWAEWKAKHMELAQWYAEAYAWWLEEHNDPAIDTLASMDAARAALAAHLDSLPMGPVGARINPEHAEELNRLGDEAVRRFREDQRDAALYRAKHPKDVGMSNTEWEEWSKRAIELAEVYRLRGIMYGIKPSGWYAAEVAASCVALEDHLRNPPKESV